MEKFVKGDIVVIPFPYSDLSNSKRRPALVLSNLKGDDIILCQITSKNTKDDYAIRLNDSNFIKGSLNQIAISGLIGFLQQINTLLFVQLEE